MAFATVDDLEVRWRPLSTDERVRAGVLLEDASQMILDERPLSAEEIVALEATLRRVVVAVVKRAMIGGDDFAGVTQMSSTTGPFTEQRSFANPSGDLYFTKAERRVLGLGGQRAFTIDPLEGYVAPWNGLVL